MAEPTTRYTFDRVVRMVLTVLGGVGLFLLLRFLADVLIPFVAAAVLAYVLNPLVTLLAARLKRRVFAVALTLAGIGIVMFALLVSLASVVVQQTQAFSSTVKAMTASYQTVRKTLEDVTAQPPGPEGTPAAPDSGSRALPLLGELSEVVEAFRELSKQDQQQAKSEGESAMDRYQRFWSKLKDTRVFNGLSELMPENVELSKWAAKHARELISSGWVALTSGINAVIVVSTFVVLFIVYLFFLLLDYPQYLRTWEEYLPPQYREDILEFLHEFDFILRRYLRGQFVVAMLTGLILAIGFSIVGLPLAIPMGLLIGVLNMVPYLQAVGVPPVLFLAVMRPFEQPGATLWGSIVLVLIVFVIAQVIQDTVLTPRIMGKATGLKPVAILLGVFIWGKLLGMLGLLLAIPLTSLGIAYYRRLVLKHGKEATRLSSNAPS